MSFMASNFCQRVCFVMLSFGEIKRALHNGNDYNKRLAYILTILLMFAGFDPTFVLSHVAQIASY